MSENAIKPLKSKSINGIEAEYKDKFERLKEQCGYTSDARFFQDLLDRFENPQRVEDRTRQLEDELQAKVDRIAQLEKELDEAKATVVTLEQDSAKARTAAAAELQAAKNEMEQYRADNELKEGEIRVFILPDNLKALDFVCARESRRRKQQWSRSHVINHFIYNRFILGNCNGDLQSISDTDCRRMGISLKAKKQPATTAAPSEPSAPSAQPSETEETQNAENQQNKNLQKYDLF